MSTPSDFFDRLPLERRTVVVDVGANPIDGTPPYRPLLDAGRCRVIGFEPQADALTELLERKSAVETYLPYAVCDGGEHVLRLCKASGMTSLFEPDTRTLSLFGLLHQAAEVIERRTVATRRLDDIAEIPALDFLKIDIQGGELEVFRGGREKLAGAVVVQTEVSFVTLYEGQPSFGEIDLEMRAQGFLPHSFAAIKRWPIAPAVINNNPYQPLNQLLEADVVYVRDFSRPEKLTDQQLMHLAVIVHYCYRSIDLALRCMLHLVERGVLPVGAHQEYLSWASGQAA